MRVWRHIWKYAWVIAMVLLIPFFVDAQDSEVRTPEEQEALDGERLYRLALQYDRGEGVLVDNEKAYDLYQQAAAAGNALAFYRIALLWGTGEIEDITINQAERDRNMLVACTQAAEQGVIEAMLMVAELYIQERGTARNSYRIFYWYHRAAYLGSPVAQINLAKLYLKGDHAPANVFEATVWYQIALRNDERDIAQLFINPMLKDNFSIALEQMPLEKIAQASATADERRNEIAARRAAYEKERTSS